MRKEASAKVQVDGNAQATPLRRRQGEINIEVKNIPGFDVGSEEELVFVGESLADLKELQAAIENEDTETVKKYLKRGGE